MNNRFISSEEKINEDSLRGNSRLKNKWVFFTIIASLCLVSIILIRGKEENIDEKKIVPRKVSVFEIGGGETQFALLEKTLEVKTEEEIKIFSEYPGVIKEDNFREGDKVEKDQILAQFWQSATENNAAIDLGLASSSSNFARDNLEKTIESSEQDQKIAEDNVDLAKINYEKAKDGLITLDEDIAEENLELARKQREKTDILAKQQILAAQNNLEAAKANQAKAQLNYEKTFIKAPITGTIVWKNFSSGDYLNPGSQLAIISGEGNLKSELYLSEKEIKNLKLGDKVEIICGEKVYPNSASIESISHIPSPLNLRYKLSINYNLNEIPDCVSVNKFVKASFKIPASTQAGKYFLPLSAVKVGQNKNTVFLAQGKVAKLREVKTGEIFGRFIEILNGLDRGDLVVEKGNKDLKDGDEITWDNNSGISFFYPFGANNFSRVKTNLFLDSPNNFWIF
jgi:RND family efflux transporter MFP subunit